MTPSETVRVLGDLAEIAVTMLLAYAVYRITTLIGTLNKRIKEEKS